MSAALTKLTMMEVRREMPPLRCKLPAAALDAVCNVGEFRCGMSKPDLWGSSADGCGGRD